MISHVLKYTNAVTITCPHSMIILLLGAGGRGNGARGPQEIVLPDQPKLGCYGPEIILRPEKK